MHATGFEPACSLRKRHLKCLAFDQLCHTCLLYNKITSLNYFKMTQSFDLMSFAKPNFTVNRKKHD